MRACRDLREIPGVRNCGSHIGQALMSDEVYGVYFGENWISVSEDVDYDRTLDAVHRTVEGYPGIYRDVQTYLRERIKEVLTGTSESIVVRIFGPDLPVLREKADEIAKRIAEVDGVVDAHPDFAEDLPHIEIELDLAAARRHGLKPGDVRRQSSTLLASEEVSDIFLGGKAYDVHVWSIPSARDSVSDVEQLPIDTPGGHTVPLEQVADVRLAPTPNHVEREHQSRRIDVGANVEGRDLASVVDEVEDRVDGVQFRPRVPRAGAGRVDGAQRGSGSPARLRDRRGDRDLPPAPRRLRQPAAGDADVPAAADGARRRRARGMARRRGAVARLAGRVPDRIRHRGAQRHPHGEPFPASRALRGRVLRPRAGAARSEGAAGADPDDRLGDRPGARAAGGRRRIPGHEIEHPMAIVILGGLVTSTLLNLFVLPSLYLRFGKGRRMPAG